VSSQISVLLVDDHSVVRKGFRRILEDEADILVQGEAGTGREAVEMVSLYRPQVVVMDLSMPEMDGVQATREIVAQAPGTAVLILRMHEDENYIRHAREAGARGYLLKNAVDVDLASAVRTVAGGGQCFPEPTQTGAAARDSYDKLTQRERQVLLLIAQGKSNKEIAQILGLSVNTVSVHRGNLMSTLDIHKTAELVLYAVRKGLVTPP
jgi:DNA-binding NarL/FixJ family response regulator